MLTIELILPVNDNSDRFTWDYLFVEPLWCNFKKITFIFIPAPLATQGLFGLSAFVISLIYGYIYQLSNSLIQIHGLSNISSHTEQLNCKQ